MRVSGRRISILSHFTKPRFWQIAMLTAAGSLGAGSSAEAALYYWPDYDPSYYRPMPPMQPRRAKVRRPAAKAVAAEKETSAKPQGPLIISVSIQNQKVRIYDANGFFAESPISTGMAGHPTPMGVFSIIQKHKFHHSNIYSGAPMPYMQRITWSGVAMHAGVLPGYPASHGCIRMPMAFAVKMWNWTKMGARVIVTPGEITPANFSHPLLATQKVVPQPVAAEEPKVDAPLGAKSDKGADAGPAALGCQSRPASERRPRRGQLARADPYGRCQRRDAGGECIGHHVRRLACRVRRSGEGGRRSESGSKARRGQGRACACRRHRNEARERQAPTTSRRKPGRPTRATGDAKSVDAEKTAEAQPRQRAQDDAMEAALAKLKRLRQRGQG